MGYWLFLLVMDLLIPGAMIGVGLLFVRRPPRQINPLFGYRTVRSTRNQETWLFAHRYCGRLLFRWGLVLLPVTLLPMVLVLGQPAGSIAITSTILCLIQLVPLVGCILPTEAALKRTFDQDGHRR